MHRLQVGVQEDRGVVQDQQAAEVTLPSQVGRQASQMLTRQLTH